MFRKRLSIYSPTREGPYDQVCGFPIRYLRVTAADGVALHAAWCPAERARGTLLQFQGSHGNLTLGFETAREMSRRGFSVFLLDYRGFGRSQGKPSLKGILRDARAAYEHVTGPLGQAPSRVVILGESLGGAAAIHLAASVPCAGLVAQATFTSMLELAAEKLGRFRWLRFFMRTRLSNIRMISRVQAPKLIIHSRDDEIIPFWMARRLYQAASVPKQFLELSGLSHDRTSSARGYYDALVAFMGQCLG